MPPSPTEPQRLITGGTDNPLLPQLLSAIDRADEIELAVAFIKSSGLSLLFNHLVDRITQTLLLAERRSANQSTFSKDTNNCMPFNLDTPYCCAL